MQATKTTAKDSKDLVDETGELGRIRFSAADVRQAARDLLGRGAGMVQEGTARAKDAAARTSARTADYVRERPLKSLAIAAAAGALIALLAGMASRRRRVD